MAGTGQELAKSNGRAPATVDPEDEPSVAWGWHGGFPRGTLIAGWFTVISSWFSGLTDRTVVDGLVNLVGWIVQESSLAFRRVQTGLVQNYALLMLFGIFAFVGVYLFVR